MRSIAIIPARGGSKRIPRKNVKSFFGLPMIHYSIETAKLSGVFDRILVSSDDTEILKISQKLGAESLDIRPKELSDDHTPTIPVINHNINLATSIGWQFDYVCCIYPCVPFLNFEDLGLSFQQLISHNSDFCFPVVKYSAPIQRALSLTKDKKLNPIFPEFSLTRTQDSPESFFDAGQFYWGSAESWLRNNNLHTNSTGFVIPSWKAVDFDTLEDWERGEKLYEANKKKLS